jgi:hypothetical protein
MPVMGLEHGEFSRRYSEKKARRTASKLIGKFKAAANGEFPAEFERNGVAYHIDDTTINDKYRLTIKAETSATEHDLVTIENSEKEGKASIVYLSRKTTKDGPFTASATADSGENTQRTVKKTRDLLKRIRGN